MRADVLRLHSQEVSGESGLESGLPFLECQGQIRAGNGRKNAISLRHYGWPFQIALSVPKTSHVSSVVLIIVKSLGCEIREPWMGILGLVTQ